MYVIDWVSRVSTPCRVCRGSHVCAMCGMCECMGSVMAQVRIEATTSGQLYDDKPARAGSAVVCVCVPCSVVDARKPEKNQH
jgi:hypothetical protein